MLTSEIILYLHSNHFKMLHKINQSNLILLTFTLLIIQVGACKKKTTDEPNPTPIESEGKFLPTTLASSWVYDTGVVKTNVTITNNYKSVFSKQYNEYTSLYNGTTTKAYYAYSKKEYTVLYSQSGYADQEITYLKENPTVGQKWSDTVNVATTPSINNYEVIATNTTVNTGTLNFTDVVQVRLTIGATYTVDAYYVKNVGLVKYTTNSNGTITTSVLKSYLIK